MSRRRYEHTERELSIIAPLLLCKPRSIPGSMIAWFSMVFCGASALACRGPKSLNAMALQQPVTTGLFAWRRAGVWGRLLEVVSEAYEGDIVMIDSTCIRIHQHGATEKRGC